MDNEPVKTAEEVIREIDDIMEVRRSLVDHSVLFQLQLSYNFIYEFFR